MQIVFCFDERVLELDLDIEVGTILPPNFMVVSYLIDFTNLIMVNKQYLINAFTRRQEVGINVVHNGKREGISHIHE